MNTTTNARKGDEFISPREAAEQLGMSIGTVKDMAQNGHLDAWKTSGGHWRISVRSVRAWLAARASVTPVFPNGKVDKKDSYLSSRQAAARLGVSIGTIQNMVDSGRLIAWKTVGHHRRVSLRSVEAYLASRPEQPGKSVLERPALESISSNRMVVAETLVRIGQAVPNFAATAVLENNETSTIELASLRGQSVLLVFYPLDFSEHSAETLVALENCKQAMAARQIKVLAVSIDSHFSHVAWKNTPVDKGGIGQVSYPLLSDVKREVVRTYGVESAEGTAQNALFLIDCNGILRYQQMHDLPLPCDVGGLLRTIDVLARVSPSIVPVMSGLGSSGGIQANRRQVA